jgi:hypothetical protein
MEIDSVADDRPPARIYGRRVNASRRQHMKRFSIALAVVALAAVGVAAATGAAATSDTVQLDAKLTATKRIDAAPHGFSAGDRSLAAGTLVDTAKKKAGRILLNCVDMPAGTGECELTFALPAGHIAVLASYGKGFSGASSAHDPIVGGTGAYATARGFTDEVETGAGKMRFTLHLER